jgi:hypothetical protein
MLMLYPEMEITLVSWSDGSINKFHAHDSKNIADFIAAKTRWYEGITYEKITLKLKELN